MNEQPASLAPALGPATGVGSMPGTEVREAVKTVLGSFESGQGMPHLPELPARGPGSDMIGRTAGLLVDMYARVEPSGWRLGDRPGLDTRRARSLLGEDLDALEEFTEGWTGPLKVQAVGPWTLAASLEMRTGQVVLGDAGAVRDLAGSLVEGLREHLAEVRRRVPGADVVLQLDEPSLLAVLQGNVPTASGYRTHRAVDRQLVESTLREVLGVAGEGHGIVHSCAPGVPFALLQRAGAAGISFDADLLTERDEETIGELVESGVRLLAGTVAPLPSGGRPLSDPASNVMGVRTLWRRLGFAPGLLSRAVVVTPACGLAGADEAYARQALAHCVRAARSLADNPE